MRIKFPENGISVHGGELEIDLTPLNLAEAFMSMSADQQADFFEECVKIGAVWDSCLYYSQLRCIAQSLMDGNHSRGVNMLEDIVKRL